MKLLARIDADVQKQLAAKDKAWEKHKDISLREACYAVYNKALERGILVRPSFCSKCGTSDPVIQGHHEDYYRPMEVVWLCQACHLHKHAKRNHTFKVLALLRGVDNGS
jgi:hypothetical protein